MAKGQANIAKRSALKRTILLVEIYMHKSFFFISVIILITVSNVILSLLNYSNKFKRMSNIDNKHISFYMIHIHTSTHHLVICVGISGLSEIGEWNYVEALGSRTTKDNNSLWPVTWVGGGTKSIWMVENQWINKYLFKTHLSRKW